MLKQRIALFDKANQPFPLADINKLPQAPPSSPDSRKDEKNPWFNEDPWSGAHMSQGNLSKGLYKALSRQLDQSSKTKAREAGPGSSLALLSRRAKVSATAKGAGAELFTVPYTKSRTLSNAAFSISLEQRLGLPLSIMAGAQPCDCNTDCRELKNVHHAISCLKHNPGGYAHNKLRDIFCSYLRPNLQRGKGTPRISRLRTYVHGQNTARSPKLPTWTSA